MRALRDARRNSSEPPNVPGRERLAGSQTLTADLERLTAYVTASPPASPGGPVLLPGEIERRTRADRLAHGIPLDPNTLDQLPAARATASRLRTRPHRVISSPLARLSVLAGGLAQVSAVPRGQQH